MPPPPVFHADFQGYNGASTSIDAPATVQGCGPPVKANKCKRKAKKIENKAKRKKALKKCKKKRKKRR